MIKYKLQGIRPDRYITKDGHTMFAEDVVKDLNRLAYLEIAYTKRMDALKEIAELRNELPDESRYIAETALKEHAK